MIVSGRARALAGLLCGAILLSGCISNMPLTDRSLYSHNVLLRTWTITTGTIRTPMTLTVSSELPDKNGTWRLTGMPNVQNVLSGTYTIEEGSPTSGDTIRVHGLPSELRIDHVPDQVSRNQKFVVSCDYGGVRSTIEVDLAYPTLTLVTSSGGKATVKTETAWGAFG